MEKFYERYASLVKGLDNMELPLPKSFRVNTLKASVKEVRERFECYGIPIRESGFCKEGFVTTPDALKTVEHFLGWIYFQELASMVPPLLLKKELGERVLDACAAPGSKTTQLAALMGNRGFLVANDSNYKRIKALKFNLEKAGAINTTITNFDLRSFPDEEFDTILLDAPCSAEGTVRKNPELLYRWSLSMVRRNESLQKQLILKAWDMLVPGGSLVYSTCTFAPEENEGVVSYLLEKRDASLEAVKLEGMDFHKGVREWNGRSFDKEVRKTARVPPGKDIGGFYLAKVRK